MCVLRESMYMYVCCVRASCEEGKMGGQGTREGVVGEGREVTL